MQALFSEAGAKLELMSNPFGSMVSKRRIELNLSQRELAKRIHKSATYINYVEQGKNPAARSGTFRPTVDAVDSIAKVLSLDINEARLAAGYAPLDSTIHQPDTIRELMEALYKLGIVDHIELDRNDLDDSPESLERLRMSLGAAITASLTMLINDERR